MVRLLEVKVGDELVIEEALWFPGLAKGDTVTVRQDGEILCILLPDGTSRPLRLQEDVCGDLIGLVRLD